MGQYAANGLATGSLYALVAVGIVILYRTTRVLNFAHGDLAAAGTFVAYTLITAAGWPFWAAALGALAAALATGAAFYLLILRHARQTGVMGQVVMTLGLALATGGFILLVWGADTKVMPSPLSASEVYRLGEVVIGQLGLGSAGLALLAMILLHLGIQRTRVGLALRGVSQNPVGARLLGIPVHGLYAATWGLAAATGTAAGMLLAPTLLLDPFFMLDPFLKGFAAAVLGGLDSGPGAVLGGLLLGLIESLFGAFVSISFRTTIAFAVILLVLLVRPEGLFGRRFERRV